MASSRLLDKDVQEEPRRAATNNIDFCSQKYSLLIITGQISHRNQAGHIHGEIERGIRSWDVDLKSCNLNLFLQEFLTHHIVSLKGSGQRHLRHSTKVLDTQVLISPSLEHVHSEVCSLLISDSAQKLLVLAGQSVEESGDLLLHRGLFAPHQLKTILTTQLIDRKNTLTSLPTSKFSLTLSCPNIGLWRETLLGKQQSFLGPLMLHVNPPEVLPAMESLGEFTSLVSSSLNPLSPFELLPPPGTVGFLKLSRPCCYVFPAGRGDCAFFAVNGFTILVDGGSDSQACFWKLVRHLDRVDALLLTHIGTSNLPGVNTFLERKVAEMEIGSDVKDDLSKRLISPELGVVFFNAPCRLQTEQLQCVDNVLKSVDQAALTIKLLKRLDIFPQPMFRPQGVPIEPLTLFQKMGVGQLELYVLHPGKNSQEYQTLMQNWPDATPSSTSQSQTQTLPLTALASVCALLVWLPACPQEKVVRVLFPGVTPQAKLLEGLEKLRGLAFLQKPTVTTRDLEVKKEHMQAKRTMSQDSGKSQGKETTPRAGSDRLVREEAKEGLVKEKGKVVNDSVMREDMKKGLDKTKIRNGMKKGMGRDVKKVKDEKTGKREDSGLKKKEQAKKEVLPFKPSNENKTKELKKDTKTGGNKSNKPSGKELKTGSNLDVKKASVHSKLRKTDSANTDTAAVSQDPQTEGFVKDRTMSDQNRFGSKISTPEDVTEDILRLREEAVGDEAELKSADKSRVKNGEVGNEGCSLGLGKDKGCRDLEILGGHTAVGSGITQGPSGDCEAKVQVRACNQADVNSSNGTHPQSAGPPDHILEKPQKAAKVVGFPTPLKLSTRSEQQDLFDLTPTEYTLLDGALKSSPPSRSSMENQAPLSPEEVTVEQASSDSRPNSAGHTPYCLSPDDLWCNRDKLSRQTQIDNMDIGDAVQPPVTSVAISEGKQCEAQGLLEGHTMSNQREKHVNNLSLGSFKEAATDPSPSVTTTTTTHSMPAEAISPQSTEVDESLSMSFEQGSIAVSQREGDDSIHHSNSNGSHFVDSDFRVGMSLQLKKPPRSLGQGLEMGRPPGPNTLHFESAAHDVDLCLVSPCEFKHFKTPDSGSGTSDRHAGAVDLQPHGNNNSHWDMSASESNAPHCTEDCPSTTADGGLDSDSDESCSEPTSSLHDHPSRQPLPTDPPPAPLKDGPPLPPQPDACMPVPQSDPEVHGKGPKAAGMRGKKTPGALEASHRPGQVGRSTPIGKSRPVVGKLGKGRAPQTSSSSTKTASAKSSPSPEMKSSCDAEVSVHVDLAYIPSGASSPTVNVDFFRRVRSSCYIISGDGPEREELMRQTLDALLDGKTSWNEPMQVTVIPTFESAAMQEWYQQTLDRQNELGLTVLGSNSTVAMQDETFPACKIEF